VVQIEHDEADGSRARAGAKEGVGQGFVEVGPVGRPREPVELHQSLDLPVVLRLDVVAAMYFRITCPTWRRSPSLRNAPETRRSFT
jgi:hypothetical protein